MARSNDPGQGRAERVRARGGDVSIALGSGEGRHWLALEWPPVLRLQTHENARGGCAMKGARNTSVQRGLVRCAIYTRKSTDENLELSFNSLDAQRESAEAYIRSQ